MLEQRRQAKRAKKAQDKAQAQNITLDGAAYSEGLEATLPESSEAGLHPQGRAAPAK